MKEAKKLAKKMAKEYEPMNKIASALYLGGFGITQHQAIRLAKEAITV